jgi:hypothetical protein
MDVADVYDWFAQESMEAGKQATEWKQRETFLRSALMWATAAQQCRKGGINAAGYFRIELIDGAENGYLCIELIDGAENGTPRSLKMPRCASSAEISLSDLWPPMGRLLRN